MSVTPEVKTYYEQAAYVDRCAAGAGRRRERRLRATRPYVGDARPVVEIGCGAGVLAGAFPGYIGLDVSHRALLDVRRQGRPAVRCDAVRLPLRSGAVRALMSFSTLEHIPEPERTLREIDRVLAPGGTAVLKDAWGKVGKRPHPVPRPLRKAFANVAQRFTRLGRELAGGGERLAYAPLTPDYGRIAEDWDAVSSIDAHAAWWWFRRRGYEGLNVHRNPLLRILRLYRSQRHYVIVRKPGTQEAHPK